MTKEDFKSTWFTPLFDTKEGILLLDKLNFDLDQVIKTEITAFLDFLLKEGYCDSDVYAEPPTAIDQYFNPKLR